MLDHLGVGQPGRVGQQPGGDVRPGLAALEVRQFQAGGLQFGISLDGVLRGVEQLDQGLHDAPTDVRWAAEHLEQQSLGGHAVDEGICDPRDGGGQGVVVDQFEAVGRPRFPSLPRAHA